MHKQAAMAYQQVARKTSSPRELESSLLSKSASDLQRIRDNWEEAYAELNDALLYNRKLWQVFLVSVTGDDHPLPREIRQNVANLGIFVMNQTREMKLQPNPRLLDSLIKINRELAAGLRAHESNAA